MNRSKAKNLFSKQKAVKFIEKTGELITRQFKLPHTAGQVIFDLIMGVCLPILVLLIDPTVFKSGIPFIDFNFGIALLAKIRVGFYTLIGLGLFSLIFFLFLKNVSPWLQAAFAGIFVSGAVLAFFVGLFLIIVTPPPLLLTFFQVDLFPISELNDTDILFTLLLGAAFFTAIAMIPIFFVYVRNFLKALLEAPKKLKWYQVLLTMIIAGTLLLALPISTQMAANFYVNQMVARLLEDSERIDMVAVKGLQMAFWCERSCYSGLANAYADAQTEEEKQRLGEIYQMVSGHDLFKDEWKILD